MNPLLKSHVTLAIATCFLGLTSLRAEEVAQGEVFKKWISDPAVTVYLPFEENYDSKVNGGVNATKISGASEFAKGVIGKGLVFSSAPETGIRYKMTKEMLNFKEGSVAFWFKPHWTWNEGQEPKTLLFFKTKTSDDNTFFAFQRGFSEQNLYNFFAALSWVNVVHLPGEKIFTKDIWKHYVYTWSEEKNAAHFYVDGTRISTIPWKSVRDEAGYDLDSFFVGRYNPKYGATDGAFDELFFFTRELDGEEIDQYVQQTPAH